MIASRNSGLMRVVGTYLDLMDIDRDPVTWFFSGGGEDYKIREISGFLFELEPQVLTHSLPRSEYQIRRSLTRLHSLGKQEYDERLL